MKKKNTVNEKMIWALIGVVAAIAVMFSVGVVSAHIDNGSITGMMGADMTSIHSMMHGDGANSMDCMSMPIEEMDNNSDGICDMCGMSIEQCKSMMGMHGSNGTMHGGMSGSGSGMSCHM